MSDPSRLKREDPARTGPNRQWGGVYRASEAAGTSWTEVVREGVELGYRVIEDQILQGQRVAQQINTRSYGPTAMGADVRETSDRIINYYTSVASLWLGFLGSLVGAPDLGRSLAGAAWLRPASAAGSSPTPPESPAHRPVGTSIDIVSTRPTHLELELAPQSEYLALATPGLRALNPQSPPLTDVAFEPGGEGRVLRLRIRVPDRH